MTNEETTKRCQCICGCTRPVYGNYKVCEYCEEDQYEIRYKKFAKLVRGQQLCTT